MRLKAIQTEFLMARGLIVLVSVKKSYEVVFIELTVIENLLVLTRNAQFLLLRG